jgi:hypothetical protein
MPTTASVRRRKASIQSSRDRLDRKLHGDAWAEKLMHMILGATMTQVALSRFLIREGIIDGGRLVVFLEERGVHWSKIASDEALLPLVTLVTRVRGPEEPDFPVPRQPANVQRVRKRRRRSVDQYGTSGLKRKARGRAFR